MLGDQEIFSSDKGVGLLNNSGGREVSISRSMYGLAVYFDAFPGKAAYSIL